MKTGGASFVNKKIDFLRTTKGKLGIPLYGCTHECVENEVPKNKFIKVLDPDGNLKEPYSIYFQRGSSLTPIVDGDLILKVFFDTTGIGLTLMRITNIDKYSNEADTEILFRKSSESEDIHFNNYEDVKLLSETAIKNIQNLLDTFKLKTI